MPVKITCSSCRHSLELEGSERDWSGQTIVCPKCSQDIVIPGTDPSIDATCPSCSTVLELAPPADRWLGKTIICPACNKPFKFTSATKLCPDCGESMEPDALVCVSCGLDTRTGKKVTSSADSPQGFQFKNERPVTTCRFCHTEMYADAPVCSSCHRKQSDGEEDNTKFLPAGVQRWETDSYRQQSAAPESRFRRGLERFKDIMFGFVETIGTVTRIVAGVAAAVVLCWLVYECADRIRKAKTEADSESSPSQTGTRLYVAVDSQPPEDKKSGISATNEKTPLAKAGNGDAGAQNKIGVPDESGKAEPKDPVEALKWLRKEAERGNADAQSRLGLRYYDGDGVATDLTESVTWLRKAAEQGHALAQYRLGACYVDGSGVARNIAEAVKWYKLSAAQGYDVAQLKLGVCYYRGAGVPRDKLEARRLFKLAAEQGNKDGVELLKEIDSELNKPR
jgi:hypothetical protein